LVKTCHGPGVSEFLYSIVTSGFGIPSTRMMQMRLCAALGCLLACLLVGCRAPRLQLQQHVAVNSNVTGQTFRDSLGGALRTPFVPGNRVVPLVNGDQFVPAIVAAIRSASNSVNIETFIWKSGRMSDQLLEALIDRARAGVEVRAVADGLGTYRLTSEDRERMRAAGIRFIRINPPRVSQFHRINFRDHRKLVIVDGRVAFTGGFCIGDKWLGNAETEASWRETLVKVEGPVVAQFQGVFAANWLEGSGEMLFGEKFYPRLEHEGMALAQHFASGPNDNREAARLVYVSAIEAASHRIILEQSYFVPDDLSLEALLRARQRGVDVQIITPGNINFNIVRRASRTLWPRLLHAGVHIYEYGPAKLHCKILIVDDAFVSVGSVNFDERSFRINDEQNVNIIDSEFGARMVADFERDRAQSRPITLEDLKKTSWHLRLFERVAALFRAQL
jgi:cardiolipin synthase